MYNIFEDYEDNEYINDPKRDDKQYTEIENFRPFEFTNNLIYELAIRNKKVQSLIREYVRCWCNNDMYSGNYITKSSQLEKCKGVAEKLSDHYVDDGNLYLDYPFFEAEKKRIEELQDEYDAMDLLDQPRNRPDTILFSNEPYHLKPFVRNEDGKTYITHHNRTETHERVFAYNENTDKSHREITRNEITPNFSRPKPPSFQHNRVAKVNLNMALNEHELIDFVKRIKEEHDNHTMPSRNVNELLGFDDKESTSLHTKKRELFANKLFVYDFITLRLAETEEITRNEYLQDELENYYNLAEREKREWGNVNEDTLQEIRSIEEEIKSDLVVTTVNSILETHHKFLKQNTGAATSTLQRYYKDIRELVDEEGYKQIVESISK